MFRVSPLHLIVIIQGGYIYIYVFLGQAEPPGTKIDDVGGSRPEQHWVVQPSRRPAPPVLVRPLGLISLTYCSLCASRDKILTLKKSQVNLSPGMSLKLKNTQNMIFMSYRVITKIRGIDGKSP
jgi:hypothetical protein